jgi:hypothetical protein
MYLCANPLAPSEDISISILTESTAENEAYYLKYGTTKEELSELAKKLVYNAITISGGYQAYGSLINATFKFTHIDSNGNGSLDGSEPGTMEITNSSGETISYTAHSYAETGRWLEANADFIINAIFGTEGGNVEAGIDSSISTITSFTSAINDIDTLSSTTTTTSTDSEDTTTTESSTSTSTTKKEKKVNKFTGETYTSHIIMGSESIKAKDNGKRVKATAGVFTYAKDLQKDTKVGSVISYRVSQVDDGLNSKSATLSIMPFYQKYKKVYKDVAIKSTVNLLGQSSILKSDIFDDPVGFFEYGLGYTLSSRYKYSDTLSFNASLGYHVSKKYIPSEFTKGAAKRVAESLNQLPAKQLASVNINATYKYNDKLTIKNDILASKQIELDGVADGRDLALYYTIQGDYILAKKWLVGLGLKKVFLVKNYDEYAYKANVSYIW